MRLGKNQEKIMEAWTNGIREEAAVLLHTGLSKRQYQGAMAGLIVKKDDEGNKLLLVVDPQDQQTILEKMEEMSKTLADQQATIEVLMSRLEALEARPEPVVEQEAAPAELLEKLRADVAELQKRPVRTATQRKPRDPSAKPRSKKPKTLEDLGPKPEEPVWSDSLDYDEMLLQSNAKEAYRLQLKAWTKAYAKIVKNNPEPQQSFLWVPDQEDHPF